MEKNVIYFIFFLCSRFDRISTFTLKHTMDRLDYVEDRLNAESKVRKDDFSALFDKLITMETMLRNILEKKETKADTSRHYEQTEAVSDERIISLLNAFREEKILNIRFRREISQDMENQTEQAKKAYERIENILEQILKDVRLLKEESLECQINLKQTKEQCGHQVEEYKKHLKPLLNQTKERMNIISLNIVGIRETVKENFENISANLQRNNRDICLDTSHGLTEAGTTTPEVTTESIQVSKKYKSCLDLYNNGFESDGIFELEIHPPGREITVISVFCDMTTDGGGWTVFQRRQDGSVDFYRDWNDYKYGFGELDGEFWLGNEYINILTDDGETHELRIDLEDYEGNLANAKYSRFKVGPESTNYTLEVSGYSGNAGDSLEKPAYSGYVHNGMQFTTRDRDNDRYKRRNCAVNLKGAWWFNDCYKSHLNGLYQNPSTCSYCIVWQSWKGFNKSMKFTEMKLR